jgi:hypothetical protein
VFYCILAITGYADTFASTVIECTVTQHRATQRVERLNSLTRKAGALRRAPSIPVTRPALQRLREALAEAQVQGHIPMDDHGVQFVWIPVPEVP